MIGAKNIKAWEYWSSALKRTNNCLTKSSQNKYHYLIHVSMAHYKKDCFIHKMTQGWRSMSHCCVCTAFLCINQQCSRSITWRIRMKTWFHFHRSQLMLEKVEEEEKEESSITMIFFSMFTVVYWYSKHTEKGCLKNPSFML